MGELAADLLPKVNEELTETDRLLNSGYQILAVGCRRHQGTDHRHQGSQRVLSDVLGQLGDLFMRFAFNSLGKGRASQASPQVVTHTGATSDRRGERSRVDRPTGPTRVYNNHDTNAMLGRYTPGGGGGATVNYTGPTLRFNQEDYVPQSAVPESLPPHLLAALLKRWATCATAGQHANGWGSDDC